MRRFGSSRSATGARAIRTLGQVVLDRLPEAWRHILADHHAGVAAEKLAQLDPYPRQIQEREFFGSAPRRSARRYRSFWVPSSPAPCPRALRARSPVGGRTDSQGRMDLVHHAACVVNETLRPPDRAARIFGLAPADQHAGIAASGLLLPASPRAREPNSQSFSTPSARRSASCSRIVPITRSRRACAVSSVPRSAMAASCHTSAAVVERGANEA